MSKTLYIDTILKNADGTWAVRYALSPMRGDRSWKRLDAATLDEAATKLAGICDCDVGLIHDCFDKLANVRTPRNLVLR